MNRGDMNRGDMNGDREKMKAVCFPEREKTELIEVPLPEPGDHEVLVRIAFSAISPGTERWMLRGKLEVPGEPPFEFPHVPGYQAAGTIVAVGPKVTEYAPGDRVFSRACRAPQGWKGSWWGGHCEYHVAGTEKDIIKIPEGVSFEEASCLLLAQVGYNGAYKPAVEAGAVAVVIGDGLVGQYAAQVLKHRGARTIISGLSPERLELAKRYSADEVYDNRGFDFAEYAGREYPGGVDIVLDTASTMITVREGAGMLKRHGQLVLNGYYPPGDSCIDWHWLRRKELTLYCADSRNDARLQATMELMERKAVHAGELVTHVYSPEKAPEAYGMLLEDRQDFLGMLIEWTEAKI